MTYMKATKSWGPCACNCGKNIERDMEFAMISGSMYLKGHENKATSMVPVVKKKAAENMKTTK